MLGVFWLNLVLAPCALAFGTESESDCPHCPPEISAEMVAHHGQHSEVAGAGCDVLASNCDDISAYAHEGRPAQPTLKDKSEPVPMAPPAFPNAPLPFVGFTRTAADPPDLAGTFPPLHLLNCVFLD